MPNNNAPQPPATPTPATPTAQTVTNAKTAAELWNALYRWATAELPKKVKVVKSHQDMASVKGTYICINYAGSWNLAGSNASKMIDNRPDLPSPRVFVYRGTVEIREVEGDGDYLMQLLESLDRPEYQYLLNDAGLSVLKAEGPQEMPALQQAQWRKESLRRNGVAIMVNKRVRKAVLGCNLKNDRMISVRFQGKPFNITVSKPMAQSVMLKKLKLNGSMKTYKTF